MKRTRNKQKNPEKFDRCVKDVKKSLKKYRRKGSAYAICQSSGAKAKRNPKRAVNSYLFGRKIDI